VLHQSAGKANIKSIISKRQMESIAADHLVSATEAPFRLSCSHHGCQTFVEAEATCTEITQKTTVGRGAAANFENPPRSGEEESDEQI
jgi:hypothetical protein